jgi:hypothetical protein
MKNSVIILAGIVMLLSCAEKKLKLELFSPDAFAFTMDDGWELNATVNVKGFRQKYEEDHYVSKVSYFINVVTPNDTIYKADYGVREDSSKEEMMDITIESQIEFNSDFDPGEYQLLVFAEDQLNANKDTVTIPFTLSAQ